MADTGTTDDFICDTTEVKRNFRKGLVKHNFDAMKVFNSWGLGLEVNLDLKEARRVSESFNGNIEHQSA